VSGTTAGSRGGALDPDAAAQAETAFTIALDALAELGFSATDVVRTRMYVTDVADADAVGRVHGRVFADINPASTLVVVSALVDVALKVEVELEAVTAAGGQGASA
jgi:enamine deaminase RidA (YjgF/YER057c/UK114 family)